MGVINVTPDSFSDGLQLKSDKHRHFKVDVDKALHRADSMVSEGAVFVDVGGESTRPGASEVSTQEELDRVIPVVQAIRENLDVCISVDTSSPEVMAQAVSAGAELINDIRALTHPLTIEIVRTSKVAVCLMHIRGEPDTMQESISYGDVVEEVLVFLRGRVQACLDQGIAKNQIMIDPGFGFGKTLQHNYQLLKQLSRFAEIQSPILVGISRKSMIGAVIDKPVGQRLAGSIAATSLALIGGAKVIRTHDVAATLDAIRVNSAFSNA